VLGTALPAEVQYSICYAWSDHKAKNTYEECFVS
jgi:hypothetical protein